MPLSTFAALPPVGQTNTEATLRDLFEAYYRDWFDGVTKAVSSEDPGLGPVRWDECEISSDITRLAGRQTKPLIHLTYQLGDEKSYNLLDNLREHHRDLRVTAVVRVANTKPGLTDEATAGAIANRLVELARHRSLDWSAKGLLRLRLGSGPSTLAVAGYRTQQVTLVAQLIYTSRIALTPS